jgi:3-oxoacyl-[acyl-carrier protein] reductase
MATGIFEGQTALVTGAAGGIGRVVVEQFLAAGARVAAVDISPIPQNGLASDRLQGYSCDVRDPQQVDLVCAQASAALGPPTILVNIAGGSGVQRAHTLDETTDAIWEDVLSLNLTSVLRFCRALVPGMRQAGMGRIVNISSTLRHGIFGAVGTVGARLPYITSKSALVGMTAQLAKDLGPDGITVNGVAPGLTLPEDGEITRRFQALPADAQQRLVGGIPTGRASNGADIAAAILFLASPAAAQVNGQMLDVSGAA